MNVIEIPNLERPHSNKYSCISITDNSSVKKAQEELVEEKKRIKMTESKEEETTHQTSLSESNGSIIIKCDCHESLIFKWFKKDEIVRFQVRGKWRPDPTLPECDSKGFTSYIMNDYNYGSLIGRILSASTFQINDNTEYKVDKDGPLLLKMNAPRSNLNSKGELEVKVFGGKDISFQALNSKTGWNIHSLCSNISDHDLNSIEEELFLSINKIRSNPKLFAEQFIISNPLLHKDFYSNDKKSFHLLVIDDMMHYALINLKKDIRMKRSSTNGNLSSSSKYESLIRISLKNNDIDISNLQFTVKQLKERNSHKILMQLLSIDTFLLSLFNESSISILIKCIFMENKTIVVIIFSKMK